MMRGPRVALFLPGAMLAAGLIAAPPAVAQGDVPSAYDKAMQLAQKAADRAQMVADAAMRDVEATMAGIEADHLAAEAFLSHELGGPREIVKNAPYSAQAITETTQVLMDGNRIVHRSVSLLARDSLGRTRQEKKTDRGSTAYIYDPIENRSYVLRTDGKTAVSLPRVAAAPEPPAPPSPPGPPSPPSPPAAPKPPVAPDAAAIAVQPGRVVVRKGSTESGDDVQVEVIRVGRDDYFGENLRGPLVRDMGSMPPLTLQGHPLALPYGRSDRGVTESLGSRDFDGLRADGKRTTRTIPAGAIGNEKPIAIVAERWFSPELNIVVMSRTIDPRSGETVYRLADIKRGEPSGELFRVPADYKVRGGERSSRSR